MTVLVLAPHNDDETLFCSFMIQRHRAHVVTVLRSFYQDERWPAGGLYHFERREAETAQAIAEMRTTGEQWILDDRDPDWNEARELLAEVDRRQEWPLVFAPLPEPDDGHPHHDKIGRLALDIFGVPRVRFFSTYTRTRGRTTAGERVDPTPDEIAGKLRALACYRSQIENPLCRPHFLRPLDEYLVTP